MGVEIHDTAIIGKNVELGENVSIGPYTIIYDNVVIGDNTKIEAHCEIGYPTPLAKENRLIIGKNSLIRSKTIIYTGSVIGEKLVTGHRVTIRENSKIGKWVQLGTLVDVQGDCEIGDYVRTNSNIFIGKYTIIKNFVWIFPFVVFTNDPHPPSDYWVGAVVEDYAAIGAGSIILPGVKIGKDSLVGAGSIVTKDVPEGKVVIGSPARVVGSVENIKHRETGEPVYPWRRRLHRGYPEEIVKKWKEEFRNE